MFAPLGKYLPSFVSPPPKAVQFSSLTPNSKGESFHLCNNLLLFLKSHLEDSLLKIALQVSLFTRKVLHK